MSGEAAEPGSQNTDWSKFFQRLSRMQRFKDLFQGTSKEVRRLEEASRLSWSMCVEDRARLQKRLDELNLNTLKQVSALKSQLSMYTGQAGKPSVAITEHSIEFHEPLQYLSETARELVLKIVEDRLRNAPGVADGERRDDAEKEKEREAQLRAATAKLKEELAAAQEKLEEAVAQLRGAMAQVQQLQMDKAQLEEERAQLEEQVAQQQERLEQLEQDNAKLQAEKEELEAELAGFRERLEAMEQELSAAKEQLEKAQEELERMQVQMQELEEQVGALEAQLKEALAELEALRARCRELEAQVLAAEQRAEAAEAEAAELRAELARRNNTRTKGEQTDMSGEHIQELKVENERLKSMVSSTMDKLQERGLGDMVKELSRGVSTILKPKSCFQRLYDDALERGERQKRLREKYSELGQQATETRFTTLDQELEQAMQVEQAVQAEEARCREARRMHQPMPPPPVDTGSVPPLWRSSPRGTARGSLDAGCSNSMESWRPMPMERRATFGVGSKSIGESSYEGLDGCGAHMSLVLQPPYPRMYERRSPRDGALRSPGALPPLHA